MLQYYCKSTIEACDSIIVVGLGVAAAELVSGSEICTDLNCKQQKSNNEGIQAHFNYNFAPKSSLFQVHTIQHTSTTQYNCVYVGLLLLRVTCTRQLTLTVT